MHLGCGARYTYSGVVVGVWLAGKAAGDDWDLSVGTLLSDAAVRSSLGRGCAK